MVWQRGPLPWSYEEKVEDFLKPGVRRLDICGIMPDCEPDSFDLVTAYHIELDLNGIVRALCKNGFLVTQQIGARNRPERSDYNLENEGPKLEAAGFRIMYSHQGYYRDESGTLQHRFIIIGKLIQK